MILGTVSLTEFSAYWAEHPEIFVAPTREPFRSMIDPTKTASMSAKPDAEKRALLVLEWFLTTLKQQYCSRSDTEGSEKKPLNPFLGELHIGHWDNEPLDNGTRPSVTTLVSEQVRQVYPKPHLSKLLTQRQPSSACHSLLYSEQGLWNYGRFSITLLRSRSPAHSMPA